MKKKYILLSFIISSGIYSQTNPGGISGAELWFKTPEVKEPNYKNFSKNKNKISAGNEQKNIERKLLNYNESLFFDGNNDFLKTNLVLEDLVNMTFFTVYKDENPSENNPILQTEQGFEKEIAINTEGIIQKDINIKYENKLSNPTLKTVIQYGLEANSIENITSNSKISNLSIAKNIDKNNNKETYYKGFLPEFILYKKSLTQSQRNRIETYLAIKYGISLDDFMYSDSKKQIIWDGIKHKNFSNNITGIGRDDSSELNQKQSTSSMENLRLIISAGNLKAKNSLNDSQIDNNSFLVWGNDSGKLEFKETKNKNKLRFLDRKWLINSTGNTSGIKSELHFKIDDLIKNIPIEKDETLWLVLDPTSKDNFSTRNIILHEPVKNSTNEYAVYQGINWDLDSSSSDEFTFAIGPNLIVNMSQNCFGTPGFNLNINGGTLPYKINIQNSELSVNQLFTVNSSDFKLQGLQKGIYNIEITDKNNRKQSQSLEITDDSTLNLNLAKTYYLSKDNNLVLDASKNILDEDIKYSWSSENGFSSDKPNVTINKTGIYTVKIESLEGCSTEQEINVLESLDKYIYVAKNPANIEEGIHVIAWLPEDNKLIFKIYDTIGRLISTSESSKSKNHDVYIKVYSTGIYNLEIKTEQETIIRKVLIK